MLDAWKIDYAALLAEGRVETLEAAIAWLLQELPYAWYTAYKAAAGRPVDVHRIDCGGFLYLYDIYPGTNQEPTGAEARTVGAIGRSSPQSGGRDDSRLRGWVASTEAAFGKEWDKGHFVAHSIGGAVDRAEINVFVQRRALNRGWSHEGKLYREMEECTSLLANNGAGVTRRRNVLNDSSASTWTIYEMVKRGELPAVRVSNAIRIVLDIRGNDSMK